MKTLLPDLTIYTVKTREYNTKTKKAGAEVGSVNILAPALLKPRTALAISQLIHEGCLVEVYPVDRATVKYVDGEITIEDVKLPKTPVWTQYFEKLAGDQENTQIS